MTYVITITAETEEDKDAILELLEDAEQDGKIENPFGVHTEESLNNFA